MKYLISSSTRNKIVLSIKKPQFISLRYDERYSKVNALNMVLLAKVAYLNKLEIHEILFVKVKDENREFKIPGILNVSSTFLSDLDEPLGNIDATFLCENIKESNTQFFHFQTNEYILIAFRGTQEPVDWATNLNAERTDFAEGVGKVHAGFYNAFLSIKPILDNVVNGASLEKPILICGHSLGGALATLAAAYFRKQNHTKVMIYTFGSPLVGDSVFVHHFTKIQPVVAYRFVHNQDLIPMIPPAYSHLRINLLPLALLNLVYLIPATFDPFHEPFTHIGKLVFLRRINSMAFSVDIDRSTPAYFRIQATLPANVDRPLWDKVFRLTHASVHDHFMESYVSILGSDLKYAIQWLQGLTAETIANTKRIKDYIEAELNFIAARHEALQNKIYLSHGGNFYADATGTGSTPNDKQNPGLELRILGDALQSKRSEFKVYEMTLKMAQNPGFEKFKQEDIVNLAMTPTLKEEFEYQAEHIQF